MPRAGALSYQVRPLCEFLQSWAPCFSLPRPRHRSRPTSAKTRRTRSSSGSRLRSSDCGVKPSRIGSERQSWTPHTPRRITIWPSDTSSRENSRRPVWRTRRPCSSIRTTPTSSRTTNYSKKSMTAQTSRTALSLAAVVFVTACTSFYEIPIETPIKAKLDVGAFQRVLVAGFLAGGADDVDGNLETTRLLRSQLRTKSQLRVIDTDVLPLMDVAAEDSKTDGSTALPNPIKSDKDLEVYEHVFADVDYWKKIGEEYQQPLIVTGTVMFTSRSAQQMQQQIGRAHV